MNNRIIKDLKDKNQRDLIKEEMNKCNNKCMKIHRDTQLN
jgi:hypothetical protein